MVLVAPNATWGAGVPASQRHPGPLYADSYAIRRLALLGQVNPRTRERMRAQHGRYLSGLGAESPSGRTGYDPTYQNQQLYALEEQDDTYGSGVFDPGGRPGTSNSNMGILASHYSLPGYVARDVPFTVSQDVSDITDDAEVVTVPGGGLSYIERRGKLQRPAILGPTWRPPRIEPAGHTTHDQVYAFMTGRAGQCPEPPLNPGAPQVPPPNYRPPRDDKYWTREVPTDPSCGVPMTPPQRWVPAPVSEVVPEDPPPIAVCPPRPCRPRRGYGAEPDKKPASKAQLAIAGLIAGAATAMVVSLATGKGRRR